VPDGGVGALYRCACMDARGVSPPETAGITVRAESSYARTASALSTTDDCRLVDLPKIHDPRGNLTFIESGKHVPFEIARAFWIYDVPGGSVRGGHAYRTVNEFIIALSGSFEVMVDDGSHRVRFALNRSYQALFVPNLIWREMTNFSTNSVALVLASDPFSADDYVRHYGDFLKVRGTR